MNKTDITDIGDIIDMATFAEMRQNRKNSLNKLTEKLNDINKKNAYDKDDRYWTLGVDKNGNGFAVIRFLPAIAGEEVPYVRLWKHSFQGNGGWYIEDSLTTINKADPCAEMNTKLWDQGEGSEGRAFVSQKSKRKLSFISNIYVVKDPANPENEGKVFLFSYGKKIFDKIFEAANPKFDDVVAFDPFDFWEGTNFKLKASKVANYRNYDHSEWDLVDLEDGRKGPRGPLFSDDAKMEKIWKQEYSLTAEVAPTNPRFKSYNQLLEKLTKAMGQPVGGAMNTAVDEAPVRKAPTTAEKFAKKAPVKDETPPWQDEGITLDTTDDEDDDLGSFRSLVD